jgi:arylsulfatase A-like enzyme
VCQWLPAFFLPYFKGEAEKSPRLEYFYFSDDGDLMALRYDNWKMVFAEQRAVGTMRIWSEPLVMLRAVRIGDYKFHLAMQRAEQFRQWAEPLVKLRVPYIMNLRLDPFERAECAALRVRLNCRRARYACGIAATAM